MRAFASEFLLPLVRGGSLRVGRPVGPDAIADLVRGLPGSDRQAVLDLGVRRLAVAARFGPVHEPPPLDESTLRLGAALHDMLVLGHPGLHGARRARSESRIASAALELARLGPPGSIREAVNRHSLLARLGEIVRIDRTVHFWLGRQIYVGRTPPKRVTAMPALRRVRVERSDRRWLRDIGVPAIARAAFVALNAASPLGEALDPLRLDPPLSWTRILPVLRFAPLARAVAGRAVDLGVDRSGDAFADALYRFASYQDRAAEVMASPEAVGFAVRFIAHLVWLDVLFGQRDRDKQDVAPSAPRPSGERAPATASSGGGVEAGVELAVLMTAAAATDRALVWPGDLTSAAGSAAEGDIAGAFQARLQALAARAERHGWPRYQGALGIARLASASQVVEAPVPGVPLH